MDNASPRSVNRVPSRLPDLLLATLAACLSIAVYLDTLGNPFVYDDHVTVTGNTAIRDLSDLGSVLGGDRFRPLVNLSFAVDHALWGLDPFGYHLTGVLLHAFNVLLLFALVSGFVHDWQARRGPVSPDAGAPRLAAFAAAALFAVHPMMTEAVGYISARGDLVSGAFVLLSLLSMRAALLSGSRGWTAAAGVTFLLALASKEVAAMLPFVLLAYDRLILPGSDAARRRRLLRLHLPLVAAVVALGAARAAVFLFVEHPPASEGLSRMGPYLLAQYEATWRYALLLVLPLGQTVMHDMTWPAELLLLGAAGLAVVCGLALRIRDRAPIASLGIAWFLLWLVPSSSIIPLQYPMAEHRAYLASCGLFMVAGAGFAWLAISARKHPVPLRLAPFVAVASLLILLSALTVNRNAVWADPVALWRDAAAKAPRWHTYMALGEALADSGNCEAALPAYEEAARLDSRWLLPHGRRWNCLRILGRSDEARQVEARIRGRDPDFDTLCREMHGMAPRAVSVQDCRERHRAATSSR